MNIILKIYEDGTIQKICNTIAGKDYADDLAHEIVLILLEKEPKIINDLFNKNQLKYYIIGIATNLFRSTTSDFQKKYRHGQENININDEICNISDNQYDHQIDHLYKKAMDIMDTWAKPGQYPFEKKLFLLYLQIYNMTTIAKLTTIPYRTIRRSIENSKQKLKNALSNDFNNSNL